MERGRGRELEQELYTCDYGCRHAVERCVCACEECRHWDAVQFDQPQYYTL